jgi:hypothetical protein
MGAKGMRVRKSILVLAITAAMALQAFPQKETGALEGTVTDQDGAPIRVGLIVDRVGYVASSPHRWELRTDKLGHFFLQRFPVGTYSVTVVSPDGRILK